MHRWKLSALASAAVVSLAMTSTGACALTLGSVSVQSAVGENLRAEIAIAQITPEEMNSLVAHIASPETFRAQGVEYPAAASSIQVQLHRNADGTARLQLSSSAPIETPFVDLLLETQWNAGQLVRSYTLLLNPAVSAASNAPTSPAPAAAGQRAVVPAPASVTGRSYRSDGSKPTRPAAAAPQTTAGNVRVRAGDTAGRIAMASRPAGVSLDQMLIAMLAHNPQAFVNGNVNRLRAGAVIKMPTREQALATDRSEARQMVAAQSRDFNAYRRGLAAKAPKAQVEAASRSVQGQVQTQVQEPREAAATPDKLTLSKGALQSAAAEAQLAEQKQAQDQDSRLSELQRNLAELNQLAGNAPAAAETAAPAATAPAGNASPAPTNATSSATPAVGIDVANNTLNAASAPSTDVPAAVPGTAPDASAPAAATDAAPVPTDAGMPAIADTDAPTTSDAADTTGEANPPAAPVAPESATPEAVATAETPAPTTPPAPTPSTDPLRSPWLPVGGGLLALILGIVGHSIWKRRPNADAAAALASEPALAAGEGEVPTATAQASDEDAAILAAAGVLPAHSDELLEEADDLLAFGRDVQAEAVLEKALGQAPDNLDIHLKLAEIYLKRQDIDALEQAARAVQDISQSQGAIWQRVVEMGLQLNPDHPYFAALAQPDSAKDDTAPSAFAATLQQVQAEPAFDTAPEVEETAPEHTPDVTTPAVAHDAMDIDEVLNSMSAMPSDAAVSASADSVDVPASLDLDIAGFPAAPVSAAADGAAPTAAEVDATADADADAIELDTDLGDAAQSEAVTDAPATPAASVATAVEDFDLGSLDLDMGPDAAPAGAAQPMHNLADPLSTKLDLAQEFNSIGDSEGARALIEEVLAEATGNVKQRAQNLLSKLD